MKSVSQMAMLILALVISLTGVGCVGPGGIDQGRTNEVNPPDDRSSEEPPRVLDDPENPLGDAIECESGNERYRYNVKERKWYRISPQPAVPIPENPPCWINFNPDTDIPAGVQSVSRSEIGLAPGANGKVQPLVALTSYSQQTKGLYSIDDKVDAYIVAEINWELPFEADPALLAEIGAGKISYSEVLINPSSEGNAMMVKFSGATLGQCIEVLGRMGVERISFSNEGADYRFELDDTYQNYHHILLYKDGSVSMKVKVR